MIIATIKALGPWSWWVLALLLMGLEILAPGTFFLWFGIAALVIGTISLALGPDSAFWVWQTQMIAFVVLSLVAALVGRRYTQRYGTDDEVNRHLNERAEQLIGRVVLLTEAIAQGRGRAKIGDTMWRISGPDMPAGTRVLIVGERAGLLEVEPAPADG